MKTNRDDSQSDYNYDSRHDSRRRRTTEATTAARRQRQAEREADDRRTLVLMIGQERFDSDMVSTVEK